MILVPTVLPPFPVRWGFSTRATPPSELPPIRLKQVHGCAVLEAQDLRQEGDGLWTTQPGLSIGVRVADCVPVLLAGRLPDRAWIGVLHAGWRGVVAGILRRGVHQFLSMGGHVEDLCYAFGPCIQPCHFEVGDDVVEAASQDRAWRGNLAHPNPRGRFQLDLHGLLRAQAMDLGLDPALDGSISRCTCCEPDLFFSYRRGDHEGRQWGFAQLH